MATGPLWMMRKALPARESGPGSWTSLVTSLARGAHPSLEAWAKTLGWTDVQAVGALGLASACRASFDPQGEILAFGQKVPKRAAWPRLEALLAAGPRRGTSLMGNFHGSEDSLARAAPDEIPAMADAGSLPAPYGDEAWAREALQAAGLVAWTTKDGERLARLFETCARVHADALVDTPELHDPALPCGDGLAWLLAAIPQAGASYFKAREAGEARLPPLGAHGEMLLALAGCSHGWSPELFLTTRTRSSPRAPIGDFLGLPFAEEMAHMPAGFFSPRHRSQSACVGIARLSRRRPQLAVSMLNGALGAVASARSTEPLAAGMRERDTLSFLPLLADHSDGELWTLVASASSAMDPSLRAQSLKIMSTMHSISTAAGDSRTLKTWGEALAAVAGAAAKSSPQERERAATALGEGIASALASKAAQYFPVGSSGLDLRDRRFAAALPDLARACVALGSSVSPLMPAAALGPMCAQACGEAEALDIAASTQEPTAPARPMRL